VTAGAKPRPYVTLDGMRGIAALAIVNHHMSAVLGVGISMPHDYLAVDIFFMLSGFVLTKAYGAKFDHGMSLSDFMRIRFIRLYPLYLAGAVIGGASIFGRMILRGHAESWTWPSLVGAALSALSFLPNLAGGSSELYPFDTPEWSLFFEIAVNLVFVMLWRRASVPPLIGFGAILVVLTVAQFGSLDVGYNWPSFAGGISRVLFGFFIGVALGLFNAPALRMHYVACLLILAGVFAAPAAGIYHGIVDLTAVLVIFPVLVAAGVASNPINGAISSIFSFLGRTSYALYALHAPILIFLADVLAKTRFHAPAMVVGPIVIIVLLILADLADRIFDGPIRAALMRLSARQLSTVS
jgi:peptidoglycan/LPS O-acetylase OafA/YrhL